MQKLFLLFLFCISIAVSGQDSDVFSASPENSPCKEDSLKTINIHLNNINLELFGNSILYSLNYERIFFHKNKFYLSGRIGTCYVPLGGYHEQKIIGVPVLINGYYQLNNRFFIEFGTGTTLKYEHYFKAPPNPGSYVDEYKFAYTAFAGIKIQGDKGFIFRTGIYTPFPKEFYEDSFLLGVYSFPIGGVSFGYNF